MDTHVNVNSGFNKLYRRTDSYSFRYKEEWLGRISHNFAHASSKPFFNARVMELGAGVHNPLACAVSAISMGASSAVAIEPGMVEDGYLEHALDHAMFLSTLNEGRARVDQLCNSLFEASKDPRSAQAALKRCGIEFFQSGVIEYPSAGVFDIIHSVAVLEHVLDFDASIAHLSELTARGGVHFHMVDFIDHDYYSLSQPEEIDKFKFLFRGASPVNNTCNRIKPMQMIQIFERYDLDFMGYIDKWSGNFLPEFRQLLSDDFQNLEDSDLAVTAAVMVFEKA